MPMSGRMALSAVATSSASDFSSAFGSRAPPKNARSSTFPSGARPGHFDDSHVPAMMPLFSTRGTTQPEPFSGCDTASRLNAIATVAADAYGISLQRCATIGATPRRVVADTQAGVAATTTGDENVSPVAVSTR